MLRLRKRVVLVSRRLPSAVEQRLWRDYRPLLNETDTPYDAATLVRRADGADALLVCGTDTLSAEVIEALPRQVKAVATFSVGYDHIDLDAAARRGLTVTNTPDVLTDATAEVAILLLLAAARGASAAERKVRAGRWQGWAPTAELGLQLSGRTLGIVGMGRIGRATAHRARAFGMTIRYTSPDRLPPELEQGATYHARVEDMLPATPFLSLHCPLTPRTRHLLDDHRLGLLPDGAVVVNTARGPVIHDAALIRALRSGKVAAAGLDVFTGEPRLNPGYLALENVVLLPHIGSATRETRDAMGFCALDNLDAALAGREPPNRVV